MALDDLTTYEIYFDDDGNTDEPIFLFRFQGNVGMSDADVKTEAVTRLQAMIDQIETPGSETLTVEVGVIHPPAHSIRARRRQDNIETTE